MKSHEFTDDLGMKLKARIENGKPVIRASKGLIKNYRVAELKIGGDIYRAVVSEILRLSAELDRAHKTLGLASVSQLEALAAFDNYEKRETRAHAEGRVKGMREMLSQFSPHEYTAREPAIKEMIAVAERELAEAKEDRT